MESDIGRKIEKVYDPRVIDAEDRGQLVLRVWGSFVAGLLIVTISGGVYDFLAHGLAATAPGFLIFGMMLGLPFIVIAGIVAYILAPAIIRHPVVWSAASVAVSTAACAFWMKQGWWVAALMVSVPAGVFFCGWMARRPMGVN